MLPPPGFSARCLAAPCFFPIRLLRDKHRQSIFHCGNDNRSVIKHIESTRKLTLSLQRYMICLSAVIAIIGNGLNSHAFKQVPDRFLYNGRIVLLNHLAFNKAFDLVILIIGACASCGVGAPCGFGTSCDSGTCTGVLTVVGPYGIYR